MRRGEALTRPTFSTSFPEEGSGERDAPSPPHQNDVPRLHGERFRIPTATSGAGSDCVLPFSDRNRIAPGLSERSSEWLAKFFKSAVLRLHSKLWSIAMETRVLHRAVPGYLVLSLCLQLCVTAQHSADRPACSTGGAAFGIDLLGNSLLVKDPNGYIGSLRLAPATKLLRLSVSGMSGGEKTSQIILVEIQSG